MLASDIKMVSLASNIVKNQQQLYAAQQLSLKISQAKTESPTQKSSNNITNNKNHSQQVVQKHQVGSNNKNKKTHQNYHRKKYHAHQSQQFNQQYISSHNNNTVNRANTPNNDNAIKVKAIVSKNQTGSEKLIEKIYDTKSGKKSPHKYNTEKCSAATKNTTPNISPQATIVAATGTKSKSNPKLDMQIQLTTNSPPLSIENTLNQQQQPSAGAVVAEKSKLQQEQQDSHIKPKPNKRKYWKNNNMHTNSININTNEELPVKPTTGRNSNANNSNSDENIKVLSIKEEIQQTPQEMLIITDNVTTRTVSSNSSISTIEKKVETTLTNDTKDKANLSNTLLISTEFVQPNAKAPVSEICVDTLLMSSTTTTDVDNSVTKTANFLHSLGDSNMSNAATVKEAMESALEPPVRQAMFPNAEITDNNNNTTYKPQNDKSDKETKQQYPYYHHQPSQLTIASFLQKDMLCDSNPESDRKINNNQQSHTQQRYQNFPHSNYSTQPQHHQYSTHKNNGKHTPMHYSNENKVDNYLLRYPTKYQNHNVHTTMLPPHTKRSNNTGSISSATSNSAKVISYRRQSHYKFRSHTNSAIETLSTKPLRQQHRNHYNNQSHYNTHYNTHYNNYQHNSGGTTPTSTTQHQNFNNLTYVSTDGYIANNISNVMKSHTRSPLKSASNMYINIPNTMPSKILNCEQKRSNRTTINDCESNSSHARNYGMPTPTCNSATGSLNSLHNQDLTQRNTHSMKMQAHCRNDMDKICVVHPNYYQHHQHVDRRQHLSNVHQQYYHNHVMPMLNYRSGYYDDSYPPAHVIYTSNDHNANMTNRNWNPSAGNMMYPPNIFPATVSNGSRTPLHSPRLQDADNQLHHSSSLSSISTSSDTYSVDSTKMSSTSTQQEQQELLENSQLPHTNIQQNRPNTSRKPNKMPDPQYISLVHTLQLMQNLAAKHRTKPTIQSLVNNETETVYSPSDRYMARAHLVEVKEVPEDLITNSKWDLLSKQIWTRFADCQQTRATFVEKMRLWRYIYILIKLKMKNTYPRYGLYLVGSTISGFGSDTSDVDMCLVARGPANPDTRIDALVNLNLLQTCLKDEEEFERFKLIEAKVPILRFKQKQNEYEVDLNFNNSVGIKNTLLMYSYSQLDWRVRPLVLVTKLWAQYHNINNAKNMTISSYSLALMVINYLQCGVKPIVLPCLHDLYPEKFNTLRIHDFGNVDMNEDLGCSFKSENKQTIGELFLGFLEYYYKFEYGKYAVSVRTAGLLPIEVCRQAKSSKNDMHQWKVLCIEEPFDLSNTARSVYDFETFEHIKAIIFSSWTTLNTSLDLNTIFAPLFVISTLYSPKDVQAGIDDTNINLRPALCENESNESTTSNSSHNSDDGTSDSSETIGSVSSTFSVLKEIINQVADSSINAAEMVFQTQEKLHVEKRKDKNNNGSSDSSCSGAVNTPQSNRSSCKTEPSTLTAIIF